MDNLVVGTDIIATKDAINQVNKNIQQLRSKIEATNISSCTGATMACSYEQKIQSQEITLSWLRKALP